MEQELGVPLFVRGHRTMRLTAEGEQLYRSLSESFAGMALPIRVKDHTDEPWLLLGATYPSFIEVHYAHCLRALEVN